MTILPSRLLLAPFLLLSWLLSQQFTFAVTNIESQFTLFQVSLPKKANCKTDSPWQSAGLWKTCDNTEAKTIWLQNAAYSKILPITFTSPLNQILAKGPKTGLYFSWCSTRWLIPKNTNSPSTKSLFLGLIKMSSSKLYRQGPCSSIPIFIFKWHLKLSDASAAQKAILPSLE